QPRKNRSVCIRQLCDLRRSESGGLFIGTLRSAPKYSGWIVLCSRGRNLGRWITRVIGLSSRDFGPQIRRETGSRLGGAMRKARFTEEQMVAVIQTCLCWAAASFRQALRQIQHRRLPPCHCARQKRPRWSLVADRFLNRDSPDESQTGINVRVFPALLQDR